MPLPEFYQSRPHYYHNSGLSYRLTSVSVLLTSRNVASLQYRYQASTDQYLQKQPPGLCTYEWRKVRKNHLKHSKWDRTIQGLRHHSVSHLQCQMDKVPMGQSNA